MRFLWAPITAITIVAAASALRAQTANESFEVASIKPRTGPRAFGGSPAPDRFVRPDATLHDLIRYAYNLQDFQIDGGPGWVTSSRFDVSAKATRPASVDQMRAMVKRLLIERFNLKTHVETRDLPIYALHVSRRDGTLGDKLRPSGVDCETLLAAGGPSALPFTPGQTSPCAARFKTRMATAAGGAPSIASMTMVLEGTTMARFAVLLQNEARRAVKNATGLTGFFDLELEFSPQVVLRGFPVNAPPASSEGPSLFTALQEQLGLKLESERGPVDLLIVDSADQPAPD
jgi:uncharacterized protein (TIGR03435 family)